MGDGDRGVLFHEQEDAAGIPTTAERPITSASLPAIFIP